MKRKFEALRENLDEFIQQHDYPALVVSCLSEELAYVLKFLQGLEEKHPQHYFVSFPNPFDGPTGYLDGVVRNIETQIAGANECRAAQNDPPLDLVPAGIRDSSSVPDERLRGVLDYLRCLLPDDGDDEEHVVVVGLLPLSCSDYAGYCQMVRDLLARPHRTRDLDRIHLVVFEDRSRGELLRSMREQQCDHVLTLEVDFSTPALTNALTEDASDPTVPMPDRMSALLQLAALDYSYRRYPDALDKYGALYRYYEGQELPSMQALCLLGTGDTLRAIERREQAKERLQQGIALAMADKALPVLVNLFLSIHGTCMELGHYEDAESYAGSGIEVAAAVLNPFAYADFHEMQGDAQVALQKLADGLASYEKCQQLCETYQYFYRWKSVLDRQREIYERGRIRDRQREIEDQLRVVEALERREPNQTRETST